MRKNFEVLPEESPKHNEIHRLAFQTPYLMKIVTTLPTTETIGEGELQGYYSGATIRIYTKINSTLRYVNLT
jgi:hypothetical protein